MLLTFLRDDAVRLLYDLRSMPLVISRHHLRTAGALIGRVAADAVSRGQRRQRDLGQPRLLTAAAAALMLATRYATVKQS